jgi:membrane-bound serine protease (ClpP class)
VATGQEEMVGSLGQVLDWRDGAGRIRVHGEIWQARGPAALAPGRYVRITAIKGLTLAVEPDSEAAIVGPDSTKPESVACRSSSTTP